MKWNKLYNYPPSTRSTTDGLRTYDIGKEKLPSVTTILQATQSPEKQASLAKWKERVGEVQASSIKQQAASRGSNMHLHLERHILGQGHLDLTEEGKTAKAMADVIIEKGLCDLSEIWGSEVHLYNPGKYAGTADMIGVYKGRPTIMDFKQTNRPKKREWIQDYLMQLAAYAQAHNALFNTEIEQGVVLMCSRDLTFQRFELTGEKFTRASDAFMKKLDLYNQTIL